MYTDPPLNVASLIRGLAKVGVDFDDAGRTNASFVERAFRPYVEVRRT